MQKRLNFTVGQTVICISNSFPAVYDAAVELPQPQTPNIGLLSNAPSLGERLEVAEIIDDKKYGLWLNFKKYNSPSEKRWFHFSRFRKNITLEMALEGAEVCRKQFPGFWEFGTVFFFKGEPLPFITGLNTTGKSDKEVITEAYFDLIPWDKPPGDMAEAFVFNSFQDGCNDFEEIGGAVSD